MKYLLILLFATLSWVSCQNTPDPKTAEVPNMEQPNPAVSPQELNQAKENLPADVQPVTGSSLVGMQKGVINGTNVTMRKEGSIKSDKIGSFDNNETVDVIDTKNVQNESEAILGKPITVNGSGGTVNLPKGKAVLIENYQSGQNTYQVTYEDPKRGKFSAQIDASAVETITYATWYNVKRKSGETGWVLGKFLKFN